MNPILSYTLHVSVAFALFYLVYKLFLSTDTFFVRNRFYLLGAMLASLISPLLKFKIKVLVPAPDFSYAPSYAYSPTQSIPVPEVNYWHTAAQVALYIYAMGVIFYLIRIVWAYHKVIRLILKSERKKLQDLILVITRLSVSPFSLLKWLVIPSHHLDHPDFENIVQHESIHSRQYHSVDLFLAEFLVAIQWFNPFAWWLKKSMVENHEFIVDQTILQNGMNPQQYQYSLLHITTSNSQFAIVNYFNANLLKKRIRMMNKNKSPKWHGIKNVMILISMTAVIALTGSFETIVVAQKPGSDPMVFINGKKSDMSSIKKVDPENIQSVNVLKDSSVKAKYGPDVRNGVIEIITKDTINPFKAGTMEDVKVIGYGSNKDSMKMNLTSPVKKGDFQIFEIQNALKVHTDGTKPNPVYFLNNRRIFLSDFKDIHLNAEDIDSVKFLMDEPSGAIYGEEGKNGVVKIITKKPPTNNLAKEEDVSLVKDIRIRNEGTKENYTDGTPSGPLYYLNGEKIFSSEFNEIKAQDIQKIEVLKDKSATAIYGPEGKNGVILITTKEGANSLFKEKQPSFDISNKGNLIIIPNPASDNVEITLKESNSNNMMDVQVFDSFGKAVFNSKMNGPTFTFSTSNFTTGVYIVVVSDGGKKYQGILSVKH